MPGRTRTATIAALCSALALASCSYQKEFITVGVGLSPALEPLFLARGIGGFGAASIKLVEFSSETEVVRAFRNGIVDVAGLSCAASLSATAGNPGAGIVLACSMSMGSSAIVAMPSEKGLRTIADLAGKSIASEAGSYAAWFLGKALASGGLDGSSVRILTLPAAGIEAAILRGETGVALVQGITLTRLTAKGARTLLDDRSLQGPHYWFLLADTALDRPQRDRLRTLVQGWFAALDYLAASPYFGAARMAPREGATAREFLDALGSQRFLSAAENRALLGAGKGEGATGRPAQGELARTLADMTADLNAAAATTVAALPSLDPSFLPAGAP